MKMSCFFERPYYEFGGCNCHLSYVKKCPPVAFSSNCGVCTFPSNFFSFPFLHFFFSHEESYQERERKITHLVQWHETVICFLLSFYFIVSVNDLCVVKVGALGPTHGRRNGYGNFIYDFDHLSYSYHGETLSFLCSSISVSILTLFWHFEKEFLLAWRTAPQVGPFLGYFWACNNDWNCSLFRSCREQHLNKKSCWLDDNKYNFVVHLSSDKWVRIGCFTVIWTPK